MDQSILEWLLEEESQEVRLRTLKEYKKLPDDDAEVVECKRLLLQSKVPDSKCCAVNRFCSEIWSNWGTDRKRS